IDSQLTVRDADDLASPDHPQGTRTRRALCRLSSLRVRAWDPRRRAADGLRRLRGGAAAEHGALRGRLCAGDRVAGRAAARRAWLARGAGCLARIGDHRTTPRVLTCRVLWRG